MFIWGWSIKEMFMKQVAGSCAACHTSSLALVGMQRFFHILWIPTIPLAKNTFIACGPCGATYPYEGGQENDHKTPWWGFSGLAVIALLISFGAYMNWSQKNDVLVLKANPRPGTYFTFKTSAPSQADAPYCFAKVEGVSGGKVQVRFGRYSYSGLRGATRAANASPDEFAELFGAETSELSQDEFAQLDIQTSER